MRVGQCFRAVVHFGFGLNLNYFGTADTDLDKPINAGNRDARCARPAMPEMVVCFLWDCPRASLADSLCPGLLSFAPLGLRSGVLLWSFAGYFFFKRKD
jgi:hypothetical protein